MNQPDHIMAANAYHNIVPISENVALINEAAYWKKLYLNLKAEVSLQQASTASYITVRDQGVIKKIQIQDIIMLEADSNYSIFHLSDGTKIISSKTLKVWISNISSLSSAFKRIHRGFFINTHHVIAHKSSQRVIVLSGGIEVNIARRNKFNMDQTMDHEAYSAEFL
jgi:DNA-binding LytR/AlgR family response regulator